MSATLHLARFTPARAARTLGRMFRGRNEEIRGLAYSSVFMLADLEPRTGGVPTPTRYGLLCGWDDDASRDAFFAGGARRFTHDAEETWGTALETVRVRRGGLKGWAPDTDGAARFERDEPLIVMTHGRVAARWIPRFTVDNRRIVRDMIGAPGLQMMVGAADHPFDRTTFSVWRSQGETVRFAYDPKKVHAPVQKQALAVPWGHDWFFARFRPVASSGTWLGRDPLASEPADAAGPGSRTGTVRAA